MPDSGFQDELAELRRENQKLKRKLADQERLTSEQTQLAEAIEALPDGLVLFDSEDRLVVCNAKYRALHPAVADLMVPGARFEEIVRAAAERGQHPEAKGRTEEWVRDRVAAFRDPGQPIEQEFSDGAWRRVYERKTADGGTVGIRTDISELKAREQELRLMEQRLLDYLDASSDWFWEMDAESRFSYFSDDFEERTGVAPEALLGKTRQETGIPEVDAEQWAEHLANLAAHHSFRDFRHPRTLPNGKTVMLSISGKAIFDGDGIFLGYRGTGRDITDLVIAETFLANAIEGLSELFVLWDSDDRLVLCNHVFREINEAIVEYTEPGTLLEDHLRAGLAKGLYPGSEGREEEWLVERLRQHRNPDKPFEARRQDGRWLLIHGQKMPDGGIVTIGTDISHRKRAEAALQAANDELEDRVERRTAELNRANKELRTSQALLEAMLDNMPDLTGLRDSEGRYLLVNKTFEKWFAVSRKNIVGKGVSDFWPQEIAEDFARRDSEALARKEAVVRHIDVDFPDGRRRTVRSARFPVFVDGDTLLGIGFINTDVTDLMRAQRDAIEKSSLLQNVLDAMPANISLRDTAGRYQFANRHLAEYVGLPAQAFVGKKTEELFPGRLGNAADAMARKVAETGEPIIGQEYQHPHASGSVFLANIVPIRGGDGKISGTVGIGLDIAERKKLEEQLRQSQKLEAVGQLTGGVAHDFNNLLGVILGNLDFLEETLQENETLRVDGEHRELVLTAIRAAEKGANLNRQLLAFSRRQPLAPKTIDLNEQISGMVDLLRRSLGEKVEVKVLSEAALWLCVADPAQIEAALLNLAINARDAMPDGGRLTIELSNQLLDDAEVADQPELKPGPYVMLAVRDTGTGIPRDKIEHVFEPFFTTKKVGQGSGLGLSMVFGFAKQSNGHVAIESEEGAGTIVKLYLPRSLIEDEAEQEEPPGAEPRARGETVLVVEDDPDLRALTITFLENLGYPVLEAAEGAAALTVMASGRVDVLLTDVVLPGDMNGSQIAAAAAERFPDLKVLYMSGYTRDAIVHNGTLDDGVLLLEKPFRKTDLARKLREAIEA